MMFGITGNNQHAGGMGMQCVMLASNPDGMERL